MVTLEYIESGWAHIPQDKDVPGYVSILRIHGPFLFGTTDKLAEETEDLKKFAAVVVLRVRNMTAIDATGLHALEVFSDRIRKRDAPFSSAGRGSNPPGCWSKPNLFAILAERTFSGTWKRR